MCLYVEGQPAGLEALDDVQFPERARAIHERGVQVRDTFLELVLVAGFRQRRPAHVVVEVDLAVDPDRVDDVERKARHPAGEHFAAPEPRADFLAEATEERRALARRPGLEHEQCADMHRRRGCLELKECRVHGLDWFHAICGGLAPPPST